MKIHCHYDKLVDIDDLKVNPKNRNKHSQDQIKRLAKILEYQGFRYPIKVSNQSGFITSGHGRLFAARLNNWPTVPVNYQNYENADQEYADVQADNAIASWAELDLSLINTDVGELGPDFDLDMLGIADFSLEPFEKYDETKDDLVPEPPKKASSKRGEIYQLGEHRLMCGDATVKDDVDKLMDGNKADMVFTDPPYGNASSGRYGRGQLGVRTIQGDEDFGTIDRCFSMLNMERLVFFLQWRTFKDCFKMLDRINLNVKTIGVWDKRQPGLSGAGGLAEQWEALIFVGDIKFSAFGGNVFSECRENKLRIESPHPHQKPIELLERVLSFLKAYRSILDPFGGSGSTLIACEKTARKCFMMEIDPIYIDVILKRYSDYTGKKAKKIGS